MYASQPFLALEIDDKLFCSASGELAPDPSSLGGGYFASVMHALAYVSGCQKHTVTQI